MLVLTETTLPRAVRAMDRMRRTVEELAIPHEWRDPDRRHDDQRRDRGVGSGGRGKARRRCSPRPTRRSTSRRRPAATASRPPGSSRSTPAAPAEPASHSAPPLTGPTRSRGRSARSAGAGLQRPVLWSVGRRRRGRSASGSRTPTRSCRAATSGSSPRTSRPSAIVRATPSSESRRYADRAGSSSSVPMPFSVTYTGMPGDLGRVADRRPRPPSASTRSPSAAPRRPARDRARRRRRPACASTPARR